jgi:hypothetical protein
MEPWIGRGREGEIMRIAAVIGAVFLAAAAVAHAETASFSAAYWDVGNQRWRDTAATPYAADPIGSYDYASATVQFEYSESGPALTGVLTGSGLKPNFTYQVKLNGKPSYFWDVTGDDIANERLGFAGRWWLSQVERSTGSVVGGWNSDDAEYASWQSLGFTDGTYDYVFEGYLLFDYVVTDATGQASQTLTVDSSLHVLWKATQRPPGPNDSDPVAHVFVVDGASDWYASSQPDETRSLYAEWEPTRALPGELSLPVGSYAVRIFLTEESFHENASPPSSGRWATVLTHDDLHFAITPPACSDGVDNDQDGEIDFVGGDPGCDGASDSSERSDALPCDNGVDDDGDGWIDFVPDGDGDGIGDFPGDPACRRPGFSSESRQCQDGLNNDDQTGIDYDGGASLDLDQDGFIDAAFNPLQPPVGASDPQCVRPWRNRERRLSGGGGCGLGFELALLLPIVMRLRGRRRRAAA